jgi:hypothetical protein
MAQIKNISIIYNKPDSIMKTSQMKQNKPSGKSKKQGLEPVGREQTRKN